MKTKYSRRSILAGGVALAGGTLIGCKETKTADDTKTPENEAPTPDSGKPSGDSIKTRTASCSCGQLSATCVGPDPKRVSLCPCNMCQRQSGSAFAIQARFPKEQVTIKGKSTSWRFPIAGAEPVDFTNCAEAGAEFHFCPVCGSTVYYTSDADDARIGIKIGTFADPTFPPPKITGHIKYRHPWTMDLEGLSLEVVQGKQH
jgi:hypothetical protein